MSWPTAGLGEVCDIVSGATPKTGVEEYWDGDIAWTTPKDLSDLSAKYISDTPRKLTESGLASCSASMLPVNSVLLSSRAPIGLVAINSIPLCTNQGFKNLIPHKERLDPEYLYWWLKSQNRELQNLGRGATFKEISKAIVSRIQIPLPPLAEQKRIAGILDAADALRARRRESIDQLDRLIQATFLEMFGDPVTNPKGWPVVSLEELLAEKSLNGAYYPKEKYSDGGIRMVHMSDAFYGVVDLVDVKRVDVTVADVEKYSLAPSDILVSRRSLNYEGSAKPCRIPATEEPLIFESSLIRVRPDLTRLTTEYLFQYLQNDRSRSKYVFPLVTRSTISGINQKNLMRVSVILPPLELQRQFELIVESIRGQINISQTHSSELETLFASLQSQAFSGAL